MGNSDNTCKSATGISNPTKLDCAEWGVRSFLNSLAPCSPTQTSCGAATNGNVSNPVDEVGLLVFPGLTSSSYASYDYTSCQAHNISSYISKYGTNASTPPYFTIVPLSSDYKTSDTSGLNGSSSNLVKSVELGGRRRLYFECLWPSKSRRAEHFLRGRNHRGAKRPVRAS